MTKIICINGFKRSGKGEVGKAIASLGLDYSFTVKTVGFADKLKIAAAKALGFDRPDAELVALMDSFKETALFQVMYDEPGVILINQRLHNLTGRQYLQWFGTEVGRDLFGENFWVDQVLPSTGYNDLCAKYNDANYLAITDCRFINEAKRALALGGEVWEILRPETDTEGDHSSEKRLPRKLVTRQIINDGSLMDLRFKVEKALNVG